MSERVLVGEAAVVEAARRIDAELLTHITNMECAGDEVSAALREWVEAEKELAVAMTGGVPLTEPGSRVDRCVRALAAWSDIRGKYEGQYANEVCPG